MEHFVLDRNKEELSTSEIDYLDTLSDDEIKKIIDTLGTKYNYHNAVQTGLKLILNSIYGAFGNEYFVCSTKDIAGAITVMGRDVVKYMDTINESYWYDYWHLDYDLHEYLGVTDVKPIPNNWICRTTKTQWEEEISQQNMEDGLIIRETPVSAYVDTDSLFVGFEPGMISCDWQGNPQDFVWKVSKFRLEKLFKTKLKHYTKPYNVENIQDFELENINESVLFVTKKKYIKHTVWEDGRQYERLQNIVPKGVSLIQKGTPKFAREKILQIINYIFDNSKTYNIKDLLKFVRELKKEFELTDINDICQSTNINEYWSTGKIMIDLPNGKGREMIDAPGVISDKEELIFAKGTYYTRKAAGLYNHLLYNHPELINTYKYITPGTKVKIYPCKHELNDKFCYIMGCYPHEFAPPVDYDELFQKTVTEPVNYYLEALGLEQLNKRLKVVLSLF